MGPCLAGPGLRKLVHPAVSAEGDSTRRELRAALSELPTDTEGSPPRLRPDAFHRRATRQRLATFQRSFPVSHPGEINLSNVPVAGCVCSVLAEAGRVRGGFNTKAFFAGENAGAAAEPRGPSVPFKSPTSHGYRPPSTFRSILPPFLSQN